MAIFAFVVMEDAEAAEPWKVGDTRTVAGVQCKRETAKRLRLFIDRHRSERQVVKMLTSETHPAMDVRRKLAALPTASGSGAREHAVRRLNDPSIIPAPKQSRFDQRVSASRAICARTRCLTLRYYWW